MKAKIIPTTKAQMYDLLAVVGEDRFSVDQLMFFKKCIRSASNVWTGFIDGELVCMWGLIPTSLLSDWAYLWLYTMETLQGNEFLFVRRSQLAVQEMLKEYPVIVGHAVIGNDRGIRWLRWLGAIFGEPQGQLIPFSIRRPANG